MVKIWEVSIPLSAILALLEPTVLIGITVLAIVYLYATERKTIIEELTSVIAQLAATTGVIKIFLPGYAGVFMAFSAMTIYTVALSGTAPYNYHITIPRDPGEEGFYIGLKGYVTYKKFKENYYLVITPKSKETRIVPADVLKEVFHTAEAKFKNGLIAELIHGKIFVNNVYIKSIEILKRLEKMPPYTTIISKEDYIDEAAMLWNYTGDGIEFLKVYPRGVFTVLVPYSYRGPDPVTIDDPRRLDGIEVEEWLLYNPKIFASSRFSITYNGAVELSLECDGVEFTILVINDETSKIKYGENSLTITNDALSAILIDSKDPCDVVTIISLL